MKVTYASKIENINHPQILYWFWTPDMIENKTYLYELENIKKSLPFDFLFLTARGGLSFYDYNKMFVPFKETVEKAHESGIKIGLQLWRNEEDTPLDKAISLITEGEGLIDCYGTLEYVAEAKGYRDKGPIKSELLRAYAFKKVSTEFYGANTLMDVTLLCKVEEMDQERIRVSLNLGTEYEGYTVYVMSRHTYRSPDVFSDFYYNSFTKTIDTYKEIPFDGVGLDEFKSMRVKPPFEMWIGKAFRERPYGDAFHKVFYEKTGMDLVQILLEMRYVEEGNEKAKVRAINYYFDEFKEGTISIENFVYDYSKKVYGEKTFVGLHNTFHNSLTNDEVWATSCTWWDIKRDYGQTDEHISYPVRMGIAASYQQSILYDMYYTEKKPDFTYEKAIMDARYNTRIHYHAYNDTRPHRFNMKNEEFCRKISPIEDKVRLLNHFDGPMPKIDLLIVFGRPALVNWYPHYEHRNVYDINGALFIMEKCDALWNAGILCALIPSNKIDQGMLTVNKDNKIEYNGRTFDSILYLYPEYSKASTLSFLEKCVDTDSLVMIEGKAHRDFDGNDCRDRFNAIANKAKLIEFSVETIKSMGIKPSPYKKGSVLEDGSVIFADLNSIFNDKYDTFTVTMNGNIFTGKYKGIFAMKVDEEGQIEKLVAGGFKELFRNGERIMRLSREADIVVRKEAEYEVLIQGEESIELWGL